MVPGWKGGKVLPLGGSFGEYSLNDLEEQPERDERKEHLLFYPHITSNFEYKAFPKGTWTYGLGELGQEQAALGLVDNPLTV